MELFDSSAMRSFEPMPLSRSYVAMRPVNSRN